VSSLTFYLALLVVVALERLYELFLSRQHAKKAFQQGGVEAGAGHFRWMVVLHTLFLPACAVEVWFLPRPWNPILGIPMVGVLVASMSLRYWAVMTLGERWNTRVIVVPGLSAVDRGPYRWVRHPNYVAVGLEMFALPLVHGAWICATVFSVLNYAMLLVRVRVEEAALATHCGYQEAMGDRPRFLPEIN